MTRASKILASITIGIALVCSILFSPVHAQAPPVSAFDDPAAVDWGARLEGARAAGDVRALIQILELAPIPEWADVVGKSAALLLKLSEAPDLDDPKETRSFEKITARWEELTVGEGLLLMPDEPVSTGKLLVVRLDTRLPGETVSLSFVLRPPVSGMLAELYEMTRHTTDEGEYVTASLLLLVGPWVEPGIVELVGSITAKGRNVETLAEIPLEVWLTVERSEVGDDRLFTWYVAALAHRFTAVEVLTGKDKGEWWDSLLGGGDPNVRQKNRVPNARKHNLVAFFYGEMLRELASSDEASEGLREAAEDYLRALEEMELRRARFEATRLGNPLPESVAPGYWWKGGAFGKAWTDVDRDLPPRYAGRT